ncbi:MAG: hypothetical protein AAFR81_11290 [Chloroflexota bacterium]
MKKLLVLIVLMFTMGVVSAQDDLGIEELARYEVGEDGVISLISGEADESHEDLWLLLVVLLPTDYVERYIVEYTVFESEDTLAYVSEFAEDQWEFGVSIFDDPERALTIIHEFAHILSLNNTQYETYPTILLDDEEGLSDDEFYDGIEEDMAACTAVAFEDGCAIEDSYLALFTEEFWEDFDVEELLDLEDEYFFFDENPDAFVTEYAATNPAEDFAETFSYFIGLDDEDYPVDGDLYEMDAKILWFEQFPELVEMRESIRENAEDNGVTFEFGESNYFFGL